MKWYAKDRNGRSETAVNNIIGKICLITYTDTKIMPFITVLNLVFLLCCIFLNYWSKAGTCPSLVLIISTFSTENHCWTHGFLYPCGVLELRLSDTFVKLNMHAAHQRFSTCLSIAFFLKQLAEEPQGIWSFL